MDTGLLLLINLVGAIALVLVVIVILRWGPLVALVLGSLSMGLGSGLGVEETVRQISGGFGELMAGIGLSIGLGVIIGRLLFDCGGAHAVATGVVRRLPGRWAFYGLGLTAFLFSIPVFFDVTFVILIPLALALAAELQRPLPYAVGAVVIGAGAAHTLVPPTPNPLAAASILGFDLGIMVLAGLVAGLVAALAAMKIFFLLLDRGLWSAQRDESPENRELGERVPEQGASATLALLPILLAIVLILTGTLWGTLAGGEPPALVRLLSHKVVAMLAGTIAAYLVASRTLSRQERESSVSRAMASAGVVLLVTGAGGAFGSVIQATGIGGWLADGIGSLGHSGPVAVLATYLMAMVFRVSQGSGTVASITTMTIIAGGNLAAVAGLHPVWLALAALAGGISIGHVNDSGFWVTAKLSGFTLTGGLKTYTLGEFVVSVWVLVMALLGSLLMPDAKPW